VFSNKLIALNYKDSLENKPHFLADMPLYINGELSFMRVATSEHLSLARRYLSENSLVC
jgi:hypothetical protein